jgi:hypothetical protein
MTYPDTDIEVREGDIVRCVHGRHPFVDGDLYEIGASEDTEEQPYVAVRQLGDEFDDSDPCWLLRRFEFVDRWRPVFDITYEEPKGL